MVRGYEGTKVRQEEHIGLRTYIQIMCGRVEWVVIKNQYTFVSLITCGTKAVLVNIEVLMLEIWKVVLEVFPSQNLRFCWWRLSASCRSASRASCCRLCSARSRSAIALLSSCWRLSSGAPGSVSCHCSSCSSNGREASSWIIPCVCFSRPIGYNPGPADLAS